MVCFIFAAPAHVAPTAGNIGCHGGGIIRFVMFRFGAALFVGVDLTDGGSCTGPEFAAIGIFIFPDIVLKISMASNRIIVFLFFLRMVDEN